jgi:anti-sigma B factor antagonist
MDIEVSEKNGITILHFQGRLDMYNVTELRESFQDLLNKKKFKVILDLYKITFIDSSALGAIISLSNSLQVNGYRLRICIDKQKLLLFHHFALDKQMSLHSSLEAALLSF